MGPKDIPEAAVPAASEVIDFLYVDKERCDSFISQIRNGTLRSVTKTVSASEGSLLSGKVNAAVASGNIEQTQQSQNKAAENYDPYHSQLIDLVNDLEISPMDKLPEKCSGKLALLSGKIFIRDSSTTRDILSVLTKNQTIFGKQLDKQTRALLKTVSDMLLQFPAFISFSMQFHNNALTGTLKASSLSIPISDLAQMYGTHIPGDWYVLGILDTSDDSIPLPTQAGSLEDAIDLCSATMNQLFSASEYKIIPILIFRQIER